jgi:hypothetical protein
MRTDRHVMLCEVYDDILEKVCIEILCIFLEVFILGSEVLL